VAVAAEGLDSQDLEVEVAGAEAIAGPVREVVAGGDRAGRALVLADGKELGEGAGTGDGGLVVAGALADVVSTSVRRDGAEALKTRARVVVARVLDDVVLGLGVVDPTVDREV